MAGKPTYDELVEKLDRLSRQVNELMRYSTFIQREAATTAPTEMETGAIQMVDTGSAQRMYWSSPSGMKSIAFS